MGSNIVSTNYGKNRKAEPQIGTSRGQTLTNIKVKIKPVSLSSYNMDWTNFVMMKRL